MTGAGTAGRILDVLEFMADYPQGVALTEIARALSLPKSAIHRLLGTLVARRFAERSTASDDYRLSLKLSALGFRFVAHTSVLQICQPVLDRLASDTGELVRMALADDRTLTWVAKAQGARFGLRYDPDMGSPVVLHATASGRAWLATMPEIDALALVEAHGFVVPTRFGRQQVRTTAELIAELARTAQRGFALAVEEGELGTVAVAMAIPLHDGLRAPGTISVAGPVARLSSEALAEIIPRLRVAVAEIGELWPILTATSVEPLVLA